MKTRLMVGFAVAGLLLTASEAWSASAFVVGNIQKIFSIAGTQFGGCMALVDVDPNREGLDCRGGGWVTFSCSGDFASRQDAQKNFEMAQLGFALEKPVRFLVQDDQTHNGYCFVSRVDLYK